MSAKSDPTTDVAGLFSNETNRGTSESSIRQASDSPANKTGAGLQTLVAPGRFSSRIRTTRREMCRTRPTAACARSIPRRSRLFSDNLSANLSANETRHSA